MHVLILNEYFPPDTAATAKMAQVVADALAERHRVTVLCGRPSYDPTERHPYYFLRREVRGRLTVERVGSTAYPRFRMSRRVLNYLSYLALAVPRALFSRCDVIVAMTDPPMEGIAGAFVATRLTGRPFVYNVRDMYPDMAVEGGIVKPGKLTECWERLHRRVLRKAARVIVLGEDMRERIAAKGVDPARIVVVRDAVPFPESLPPADHPVIREIRGDFRFVLVLRGKSRLLWCVGDARALRAASGSRHGVGLVFIGEGASEKGAGAGDRSNAACRNVRFLPFRPVEEVPCVMAAGDLHVVTVKRGLEGVVVPSKVYNILAAGRPLLAMATERAEVAQFARRDGCGIAADPDDPAAAAEAVRWVMQAPEILAHMSGRCRELARGYNRAAELRRFVRTVEEASGARPGVMR